MKYFIAFILSAFIIGCHGGSVMLPKTEYVTYNEFLYSEPTLTLTQKHHTLTVSSDGKYQLLTFDRTHVRDDVNNSYANITEQNIECGVAQLAGNAYMVTPDGGGERYTIRVFGTNWGGPITFGDPKPVGYSEQKLYFSSNKQFKINILNSLPRCNF